LQVANRDLTGDSNFVVSGGKLWGGIKTFVNKCGLADRRDCVNSVEEEKKWLVVVGLGEERELVKLLCDGLVTSQMGLKREKDDGEHKFSTPMGQQKMTSFFKR
jgi:hypothetical protein